jgi:hypothetical protein
MKSYLKEKIADPAGDTPLSAKVGTKIRRPEAVDKSVQFACGLYATEFVRIDFK